MHGSAVCFLQDISSLPLELLQSASAASLKSSAMAGGKSTKQVTQFRRLSRTQILKMGIVEVT